MPLRKRKPFPLVEPPQDLDPNELVYQIRFTKEIFRDYQEYLNRLNLYRQRVWTCKVTGKTNLTYEEALVFEHRATEKVQQFPKELMPHVLRIIQYSTLSLTDLVETIHTKLQEHLLEGIELHGRRDQSLCACKILEIVEDRDTTRYKVGWLDKDKTITDSSVVSADDLMRKKPPISRSALKAFIRDSTSRSMPWVVHEKLAEKHGIFTEPPKDLGENGFLNGYKKRRPSANGNMTGMNMTNKKAKTDGEEENKEPVKYPIDDLLVQPAEDDPIFTDRPSFCTNFKVPMDCVGDLLMIWDFCSSFGRLLNLWRFSLEDFETAICHKDSNLILLVEVHAAILRLLIKNEDAYFEAVQKKKRKSKIRLYNWTEFLCDFLEMEGRGELSKCMATIKRGHYGLLGIHVKLGILRELVAEALTTNAIRARLDECIEQQQTLAARKRDETKRMKDEQHLVKEESDTKEACKGDSLQNGKGSSCRSEVDGTHSHHENVPDEGTRKVMSSKKNHMRENGEKNHAVATGKRLKTYIEDSSDKVKDVAASAESSKGQPRNKHNNKETRHKLTMEEKREHLEREIEKLSIRTNPLGKDRNYNRYWFFQRDGRLFVESSDFKQWGYYTTKQELDALIGSLNPKGERERALQRQLEKYYLRISAALQKRSKDVAQRDLLEDAVLRRSTRVRAPPRDGPAMAFLEYVNKWKQD